jgi:hypothetical protein
MSSDLPSDGLLDRATDPQYAAVSPRAVLGLLLSAAGVSAPAAWPLVAVPIAGAIVSAWAWRRIRRSEGVLTGKGLALAGLILGIALAVVGGGYHGARLLQERRTLQDLRGRALEVTDRLLEGRYGDVYARLPGARQADVTPAAFAAYCRARFEGAGGLLKRDLMALRIVEGPSGRPFAPAEVQVDLQRRILRVAVIFEQTPGGTWDLLGIQAEPTFESFMKYGGPPPPMHGHGHHH